MTEASITQGLLAHLKKTLPGAVIFKLSDRFTKGIPDLCVAWNGKTAWLEVKLLKKGDALAKCSPELQRLTMERLHQQTGGRAWYVIYDARTPRSKMLAIYAPHAMLRTEENEFDHCTAVAPGFAHQAVVRLLETI